MLTILFLILAAFIFFKVLGLMFKLAWGVGKLIFGIIFFPIILLIALIGLAWVALPVLLIIGLIIFLISKSVA